MKYSVVICCYNGEQYIDRCIKCLEKQTYQNFEILFINDGSTDNSMKIINKYKKIDNLRIIKKKNEGISITRNLGISEANGEYILFLDVDDTLEPNALELINATNEDLIRYGYRYVYKDYIQDINTNYNINTINNEQAFKELVLNKTPFDMAAIYVYKKDFLLSNNISFEINRYHEDYGLIPYLILIASKVRLINDIIYNYYQTSNSITRNDDYKKTVKKANDMMFHTINMNEKVKMLNISNDSKQLFFSYTSNAVLSTVKKLDHNEKKEYINDIKKYKLVNNLLSDNIKRKIKKLIWYIKIYL